MWHTHSIAGTLGHQTLLKLTVFKRPMTQTVTAADLYARVKFDDRGLVPAIAQAHDTGEVLMLAWMNAQSITESLATGRAVYWSRSRGELWRKGDTSGHVQRLIEMRIDCDGDTLLLKVEQTGPACHTGARSCFFTTVD